jgi:tetratricopeptide (TPR) repeat protein
MWCDRLIEAGWLAALIVAPLFFNIWSSRVFEPDKITTVRSIALLMSAAWIVKWLDSRGSTNNHPITWRTPLIAPILVTVIIYMISTAMSVGVRTSLLGSYQRLQGTYTTFSYIIIFLMILQGLRTRTQLNRVLNIMIIVSLPISLYGILQRAGLDPLPWGGDTVNRVAGNMGNAIFIAAYLIMVFFVTLGKLAEVAIRILRSASQSWMDLARAAFYVFIAILNAFVVLVLSGSRGPQLGWITGLFFASLLMAQLLRNHRTRVLTTFGLIIIALLGLGFLAILNFDRSSSAIARIRELPVLNRLSTAFETNEGTNLVRTLIWDGNVNLVLPHEPIDFPPDAQNPDGRPDSFNTLRLWFGYGPESMYTAYNRFYPPALANIEARNASPDRSHDETWDSLVITGIFGLLAHLFLFGSVFYYAFKWIGLSRSRSDKYLFTFLWGGGAVVGGFVGATLTGRPGLFGVGLAIGAVAGLTLFVIIESAKSAIRQIDDPLSDRQLLDRVLIVCLISGIVAHYVEIQLGIAIVSTRTTFWVMAALISVIGLLRVSDIANVFDFELADVFVAGSHDATEIEQTARMSRRVRNQQRVAPRQRRSVSATLLPRWFGSIVTIGLFVGLIMGVLSYTFITNSERVTVSGAALWNGLTQLRGSTSYAVLGLCIATWLIGCLTLVFETVTSSTQSKASPSTLALLVAISLVVSLFIWVAYGTFHAGQLVSFIAARATSISDVLPLADQISFIPAYIYLLIACIMVSSAFVLSGSEDLADSHNTVNMASVIGIFLFPIVILPISTSNLQPIRADIVYKQAGPYDSQASNLLVQNTNIQGWDIGLEHHRRAIGLAPNEDFYYLWLGRDLLEKAKATSSKANPTLSENVTVGSIVSNSNVWNRSTSNPFPSSQFAREDLILAANKVLSEARRVNPLNTDHSANIARMWTQSGDIATDKAVQQKRYENSSKEYKVATSLSPQNAQLHNEWAILYAYKLNDLQRATQLLDHSIEIDPKYDQTYIIRADFRRQAIDQAANNLTQLRQQLASTPTTDTVKIADLNTQIKTAETDLNDKAQTAIADYTRAISINKNLNVYNILASLYQQIGNIDGAIETLTKATEQNPKDWSAYFNLAVMNQLKGKLDLAKANAQRAIDLATQPQDQQRAQTLLQQLNALKQP